MKNKYKFVKNSYFEEINEMYQKIRNFIKTDCKILKIFGRMGATKIFMLNYLFAY